MSRYIGKELSERMNALDISPSTLAEKTFLEESYLNEILNNKKSLEDIDAFDLELISSVLHCASEYFTDASVRNKDLLFSTINRGVDTVKSRMVKVKIQDYLRDYAMVTSIMNES